MGCIARFWPPRWTARRSWLNPMSAAGPTRPGGAGLASCLARTKESAHDPHDAVRSLRRNAGRPWRQACVRHRRLGLHGRARPVPEPPASASSRSPTSRAPATWPTAIRACSDKPRRLHRPERPGHHQFRDRGRRRLLGAFAGGGDHAGDRLATASAWAASRRPSSCRSSRRSPSTRPMSAGADRIAELTSRCFDLALTERGPTQLNIPRDYFYGEIDVNIPEADQDRARRRRRARAWTRRPKLLAEAKFPVIVAGGGVIMSRRRRRRRWRWPSICGARSSPAICTTTPSRPRHPLMCGPLGYQGSKAAMKLIAQADVVLALGTRLGPFGTLPQHGIEYWPKNAKIIQVDSRPPHARPGEADRPSASAATPSRPPRSMLHRLQTGNVKIAAHGNKDAAPGRGRRSRRTPGRTSSNTMGPGRRLADRAAPRAARAREGDAEERHGHHRHRQHLLGRPTAICASSSRARFFAAMSFGNCGYAYPDRHRRQGRRRPTGRPSPMSATAPGA